MSLEFKFIKITNKQMIFNKFNKMYNHYKIQFSKILILITNNTNFSKTRKKLKIKINKHIMKL